ncbi:MAG: hypothetical protein SFU56_15075 [Capsulimonadales bacterium]|nr:hypothetical protein [Capsulimonadales bacterium]
MPRSIVVLLLVLLALPCPVLAGEHLLFCNNPEKIRLPGAYGNALLRAGETYTIFYHFRNVTRDTAPFVIGLRETNGSPLRFSARQGLADPNRDPSVAGRQAMARYLSSPDTEFVGKKGFARFAYPLRPRQVASGVLTVRCETDAVLRLYFRHDRWTAPGVHTIVVPDPRREIEVSLSGETRTRYFRIGEREIGMHHALDGTYGMLYAFRIDAPEGRRVRVSFSPRGGKAGLVGSLNGKLRQSRIIPATHWRVFCEAIAGKNGLNLTTAPFGGVFYPVELLFELL